MTSRMVGAMVLVGVRAAGAARAQTGRQQEVMYKRLGIGAEVLYGRKEVKSGNTGDDVRVQFGAVYSVFA